MQKKAAIVAWSISGQRGLIHTNWLVGVGKQAWFGAFDRALFGTREQAREQLRALTPQLPFKGTWRVVKVLVWPQV